MARLKDVAEFDRFGYHFGRAEACHYEMAIHWAQPGNARHGARRYRRRWQRCIGQVSDYAQTVVGGVRIVRGMRYVRRYAVL